MKRWMRRGSIASDFDVTSRRPIGHALTLPMQDGTVYERLQVQYVTSESNRAAGVVE
ncbi:hypothetical protein [Paenibacillus kobensis]|uniref:hypothetical protein n=1 Tax=Paenibacillus kobensis TaxID=59841 RepID=UPI0013E33AB9|nr:hypothetical protein [Paenibacillus kobensis]